MSLYLKHRPKDFDEMIGNEETIKSLESLLQKENRPHTYLFTGASGCGKTTAARICAKRLGAGELSLMELNSSNNRGVETARDIIAQMKHKPISGESWNFIIDECHMMTSIAQNALLKPLEDTNSFTYFFLCTTDPQKLIKPLKNRCTVFNFPPLESKYIAKLLRRINKEEKAGVENNIINKITENSNGSPRKAIVLFEKIIEMDPQEAADLISGGMTEEGEKQVIDLCRALLKGGWTQVSGILRNLNVKDPEKIRRAVMGYMNAVLLKNPDDRAAVMLEYFSEPFYDSGMPGVTLACYQGMFSGMFS